MTIPKNSRKCDEDNKKVETLKNIRNLQKENPPGKSILA
jgi:hypothetical protein